MFCNFAVISIYYIPLVFGIIQKKGDPQKLTGRVIGYVKIQPVVGNEPREESPFDSLVSPEGFLAIQGDYSKTPDFDSFRSSFPTTLPQGLQDILKNIFEDDDLKDIFDVSKIKSINVSVLPPSRSSIGEFFPVPAQLVPFKSEDDLLKEDSDIFYLGEFSSVGNAHLFLMGFPILYQSKYKEYAEREREKQVDALLSEIDGGVSAETAEPFVLKLDGDLSGFKGNLLELLVQTVLPNFMYSIENESHNLQLNINVFRKFMRSYPYQQDLDEMESVLKNIAENKGHASGNQAKKLALLCQKINALHKEEFESVPEIQKQLDML